MQLDVNGEPRHFEQELSISELIEALEFTGRRIAVERNGMIVPRSQHEQTQLEDGDRLEIVQAVGGG